MRPTTSTAAPGSPRALTTPIAGYETELGLYGFRELIRRGAVDIVQPDVAWTGGFSEGKRIAAFAQAHHRMVAPHAFAGAVLLSPRCITPRRSPTGWCSNGTRTPTGCAASS